MLSVPRRIVLALFFGVLGCRSEPRVESAANDGHYVLSGGTVAGVGRADVEIRDGRIVAVGSVAGGVRRVDVSGKFLAPSFVDSHVHLAYRPRADELARGGVAAVVDLAAPEAFLSADVAPLRVIAAGPMITAVGGYPTESWGAGGYGREVDGPVEAAAAVDALHALGARVVKLPITDEPALDDAELAAATARAHQLGMKVVVHALGDREAARAARAGADVLAHTPVEALSENTLELWSDRAVVSTLSAFGGEQARANLAALRARGTRVVYGTDFGNTTAAGISAREIEELGRAGLDGAAILAAATREPALLFGLHELGAIAPGKRASLLVLDADPHAEPETCASPSAVYVDGVLF
jgi:imidazolonepropionase-like amidohydrolase